jgi:hypothetical protein
VALRNIELKLVHNCADQLVNGFILLLPESPLLNCVAPLNMLIIVVTLETSQFPIS